MEIKVYRMENLELRFASNEEEIQRLNDMCLKEQCEYLFTINDEQSLYSTFNDFSSTEKIIKTNCTNKSYN